MRSFPRLLILLAGLGFVLPLLASYEPTAQELQTNRLLLKRWRSDPDHYARLKGDLKEFLALTPEKQEALRHFDRELHDENPKTQERLWRVLDRYSTWLDRLNEEDRRRVEEAGEPLEKALLVKELRQREWIAKLPKVDKERVGKVPPGELRDNVVASLRREERERRYHLRVALARQDDETPEPPKPSPGKPEPKPPPDKPKKFEPTKLAELPKPVREYYRFSLRHVLTDRELGYLEGAAGQWPAYVRALKSVSDKHEIRLPPGRETLETDLRVLNWLNLPTEWLGHLQARKQKTPDPKSLTPKERGEIQKHNGRWPDFAFAIHDVAKSKHWESTKRQLGPCRPEEFQPEVERFIRDELMKGLTEDSKAKLKNALGIWPDYPLLVMKLAKENSLRVPLTFLPTIPGAPDFWNKLPKDDK